MQTNAQTYFMSLFFLIAGYFTPMSFDKKGAAIFLKERLLRLGVPLMIFIYTLSPFVEYIKYVTNEKGDISFWEFYKYLNFISFNLCPGPLWFIETLLFFSFIYAILRLSRTCRITSNGSALTNRGVLIFIVIISLLTFVSRIAFPAGREYFHLQLGYYVHYISLYIVGIIAYKENWMEFLSDSNGKLWIFLSVFITVGIAIILRPILLDEFSQNANLIPGGFSWESLFISSLESSMCVGIIIAMLYSFRKMVNAQKTKLTRLLSENAYAIYIIHAPVIVLLSLAMKDIPCSPVVKFGIVAVAGIFISALISNNLIRKLPYAKKNIELRFG